MRDRSNRRVPARRRPSTTRRGAIVVELLINLPIWIIGLLALIQFGQIVSNLQQVKLASRAGAEVASQLPNTSDFTSMPGTVVSAVNRQLSNAGITASKIILEQNVVPTDPPLTWGSGSGTLPGEPALPVTGTYVRVTVFAPAVELTPNLLRTFGLDIDTWMVRDATTFQYER